MAQPIKNKNIKSTVKKSSSVKRKRKHKEYGTSKLEEKFARDFLDKLKVNYVYQFKAESIGRYYDFYLPDNGLIIEVDGDYWHSKGLVYEEMTPTQKKNRRVDKQKDHWALINGIPILRIWESDINKHPEKVMETLKERLYLSKGEKEIKERKKYRNFKKDDN